MLSDRHMYAVNILMKEQFPDLDGLHSTLLSQSSGFPEINISGGYMHEGMVLYSIIMTHGTSSACVHYLL